MFCLLAFLAFLSPQHHNGRTISVAKRENRRAVLGVTQLMKEKALHRVHTR